MKDEDIQNLLGGFATDTLSDRERELLFTAALRNQKLFDALADEQALRELLSDPASRNQILRALRTQRTGVFDMLTRTHRPVSWAIAGAVMAALVSAVIIRQSHPPLREMAKATAPTLPSSTAAPAIAAPSSPANKPVAAPKLKVAVVDFNSTRTLAKEADTASERIARKLDLSGYNVIDRKRVDEALQAQNLNRDQLDSSTAANLGRSLGADAVIVGSVGPAGETAEKSAEKSRNAVNGFRQEAPAARVAGQPRLEVRAKAINTQTAASGLVAAAQTGQKKDASLADAVDQVAFQIGQQIQQNVRAQITGSVTEVASATVTLNVGWRAGIKVGDRLEVSREGKPVGAVVISSVKESTSVGVFQGDGPAKVGDSIATQ